MPTEAASGRLLSISVPFFLVSKPHEQHQSQGNDQFQIVPFHQQKQDDQQKEHIPCVDVVQMEPPKYSG